MSFLRDKIGTEIARNIEGFRYVKSKGWLFKKTSFGWNAILIDVVGNVKSDNVSVQTFALINLKSIEDLYTPHHIYLEEKYIKQNATVSVNCSSLFSDANFEVTKSFVNNDDSINKFAKRYVNAVQMDVLDFFMKYSSVDEIFESFRKNESKDWISSNFLQRYIILLSILTMKGKWKEFETVSVSFRDFCKQDHAVVYKDLAESIVSGLLQNKNCKEIK